MSKRSYRRSSVLPNGDNRIEIYGSRKYLCNFNFFETIDTEAKAYWLGFFAADGCVRNKGTIVLALAAKDLVHLERFKKDLEATYRIYKYSARARKDGSVVHPVVNLTISSQKMVRDLEDKGIGRRKTFTLDFPSKNQVPDHLMRHYLRGYFDGDGCIYKGPAKPISPWCFSIISTRSFCHKLFAYLFALKPSINSRFQRAFDNGMMVLSVNRHKDLCAVRHLLYDGATIYLSRKKEIFDTLSSNIRVPTWKAIIREFQTGQEDYSCSDIKCLLKGRYHHHTIEWAVGELYRNGIISRQGQHRGKPIYHYDFEETGLIRDRS